MLKTLKYLIWLGVAVMAAASHGADSGNEYQLKTAYLFHFAELTEWPAASRVNICVRGSSPIRKFLPILNGQKIADKSVQVTLDDAVKLDDCQMLFVGDDDSLSPALLEQVRSRHVLLVGDREAFARQGGMIEFTLRENKLKLVVNLNAVRRADLKLSSKLLRMAEILE